MKGLSVGAGGFHQGQVQGPEESEQSSLWFIKYCNICNLMCPTKLFYALEAPNPKPETLNPKPKTPNPTP